MKKVLVPTDFSANSEAGVRFAINWATQQKLELVFVHVFYVLKATRWTDAYYAKHAAEVEELWRIQFESFITSMYEKMEVKPGKHSYVFIQGIGADITIIDYCSKNPDIDCICISTRGAGKFKKIFGTNTGNLITKSAIPVLAVPQNYKAAEISKVLYATDLRDYATEINKVVAFARPLKTEIEVVHFTWPGKFPMEENLIKAAFKKQFKYGLTLDFENNEAALSLIENLKKQIKIRKPSLVLMFTDQKRTFFQKLFLASKSENLSFETKVPLLVFNKP